MWKSPLHSTLPTKLFPELCVVVTIPFSTSGGTQRPASWNKYGYEMERSNQIAAHVPCHSTRQFTTTLFFSRKTRGGRALRSRQKTNPTLEWWILRTHSRWDLLRHKFTLRVPLFDSFLFLKADFPCDLICLWRFVYYIKRAASSLPDSYTKVT